jgi:uncharacterized membrane protein
VGQPLAKVLVVLTVLWPVAIVGSVSTLSSFGPSVGADAVYALSSRICHQKPDRSFESDGHQWPVCARCTGLYCAVPVGALAGLVRRRRADSRDTRLRAAVVGAALPTMGTLVAEWAGLAVVSNVTRALAALPLGAAGAYVVLAAWPPSSNQVD